MKKVQKLLSMFNADKSKSTDPRLAKPDNNAISRESARSTVYKAYLELVNCLEQNKVPYWSGSSEQDPSPLTVLEDTIIIYDSNHQKVEREYGYKQLISASALLPLIEEYYKKAPKMSKSIESLKSTIESAMQECAKKKLDKKQPL